MLEDAPDTSPVIVVRELSETRLDTSAQTMEVAYTLLDLRADSTYSSWEEQQRNRLFTADEMRMLLEATGFDVHRIEPAYQHEPAATGEAAYDVSVWGQLIGRLRRLEVPLVPVTLTAYHDFQHLHDGPVDGPAAWDSLRSTNSPFGLPATRTEWEAAAVALTERARRVAQLIQTVEAQSVVSYGVGTGMLELRLTKELPGIALTCTDFAPVTAARLKALFPESAVVRHDLLEDDPIPADLAMFHRIETELDDRSWRQVYARFAHQRILVIVDSFLTIGRAIVDMRRQGSRVGYMRNEWALRRLWHDTHTFERVNLGLPAFLLDPR